MPTFAKLYHSTPQLKYNQHNILNMTKHISLQHSGEYESPKCEVLELGLENGFLTGSVETTDIIDGGSWDA